MQSFVHDSHSTISNKETFLHNFLVILNHSPQNYQKILRKCYLGVKCIVIILAYSNLQQHNSVDLIFQTCHKFYVEKHFDYCLISYSHVTTQVHFLYLPSKNLLQKYKATLLDLLVYKVILIYQLISNNLYVSVEILSDSL